MPTTSLFIRSFLFTLFLPGVTLSVFAQSGSSVKTSEGLRPMLCGARAAYGTTTYRGGVDSYGPRTSLGFGAYVPFRLGGEVDVQPELEVCMRGARALFPGTEGGSVHITTIGVQLPVVLKWWVARQVHIGPGLRMGGLVSSNRTGETANALSGRSHSAVTTGWILNAGVVVFKEAELNVRWSNGITGVYMGKDQRAVKDRTLELGLYFPLSHFDPRRRY